MTTIYSDVNADFGLSSRGELLLDINAINSSIENILSTVPGERVFLPEFGSNIWGLLFDPVNENTADTLLTLLTNAVERWENRVVVDVRKSRVIPNYDENSYEVYIAYIIVQLDQEGTYNRILQI